MEMRLVRPQQHTHRALPLSQVGFPDPRSDRMTLAHFVFPLSSQLETEELKRLKVNSCSKVNSLFYDSYMGNSAFLVLLENKVLRHCRGLPGMCVCIHTRF